MVLGLDPRVRGMDMLGFSSVVKVMVICVRVMVKVRVGRVMIRAKVNPS